MAVSRKQTVDMTQKQVEVLLTEINSALHHIAFMKTRMQPHGYIATNGSPVTIPDGVKAFNVINLGENAGMTNLQNIGITGVTGLTYIPSKIQTFCYSIENDQNVIAGPVVITPAVNQQALVQYLL